MSAVEARSEATRPTSEADDRATIFLRRHGWVLLGAGSPWWWKAPVAGAAWQLLTVSSEVAELLLLYHTLPK